MSPGTEESPLSLSCLQQALSLHVRENFIELNRREIKCHIMRACFGVSQEHIAGPSTSSLPCLPSHCYNSDRGSLCKNNYLRCHFPFDITPLLLFQLLPCCWHYRWFPVKNTFKVYCTPQTAFSNLASFFIVIHVLIYFRICVYLFHVSMLLLRVFSCICISACI